MDEIYQSYVENAFDGYHQAEFKIRQFQLNYKRFFPIDKASRTLDIGIGRGEMLTCLKQEGYANYLGIDISPSTVNFCTSLGLNCVQVDDTTKWLSAHRGSFSLITLLDVLEHFKKEATIPLLKAIRGALRDDGTLIIQVPNMQSPDSQLHRYNDFTHEVGYVEHSLNQLLQITGFTSPQFFGFEEFISQHWSRHFWLGARELYWNYVRFIRRATGNLNPYILNPVLSVKVMK
jgi:2-polyprenyl-3-methyl-5-hydroxy-6-metoxy-1,4-benzoquinol methylase